MLREALGLTQAQVAQSLNISREYISKIEKSDDSVAQKINPIIKKEIFKVLGTTEEWLFHGLGFTYHPKNHMDYINFYIRQLKNVDKIIFVNNFNILAGYCFVSANYSVSMSKKIYDTNMSVDVKKLYEDIIGLYAYKQVIDFTAIRKNEEQNFEILVAEYKDDDESFKKKNFDEIMNIAKLKNFLADQQGVINQVEYDLLRSFDFQPTKNELFLFEKIRQTNFDIFELMKYIDSPTPKGDSLKNVIEKMTIKELKELSKEVNKEIKQKIAVKKALKELESKAPKWF
ncbi:MAG: helix-turn-helix protein [Deltaproteobacteria bacterium ADurb.Bin151]|nr:MAG: helix-turn-helix protein [Deltaproteobacteria bacterium ADurb.Bin151]